MFLRSCLTSHDGSAGPPRLFALQGLLYFERFFSAVVTLWETDLTKRCKVNGHLESTTWRDATVFRDDFGASICEEMHVWRSYRRVPHRRHAQYCVTSKCLFRWCDFTLTIIYKLGGAYSACSHTHMRSASRAEPTRHAQAHLHKNSST